MSATPARAARAARRLSLRMRRDDNSGLVGHTGRNAGEEAEGNPGAGVHVDGAVEVPRARVEAGGVEGAIRGHGAGCDGLTWGVGDLAVDLDRSPCRAGAGAADPSSRVDRTHPDLDRR